MACRTKPFAMLLLGSELTTEVPASWPRLCSAQNGEEKRVQQGSTRTLHCNARDPFGQIDATPVRLRSLEAIRDRFESKTPVGYEAYGQPVDRRRALHRTDTRVNRSVVSVPWVSQRSPRARTRENSQEVSRTPCGSSGACPWECAALGVRSVRSNDWHSDDGRHMNNCLP
jgi:hypothetical protein